MSRFDPHPCRAAVGAIVQGARAGFDETRLRNRMGSLSPRAQWFLLSCAQALASGAAPAPMADERALANELA